MVRMQKKPYDFNRQIMGRVESLCAPLYAKGITHFAFLRFTNNKILRISDRPDWLKVFFEKGFFNDQKIFQKPINELQENERREAFLTNSPKSDHERCLVNQNIWHFNLNYMRKKDHVDLWAFASDVNNDEILNLYANEKDELDQFVDNFRIAVAPHLDGEGAREHLVESHITVPKLHKGVVNLTIDFFSETRVVSLNADQAKCASLITQGYKPSQMMKELNFTKTHVDECLSDLRYKLRVSEDAHMARVLSNNVIAAS